MATPPGRLLTIRDAALATGLTTKALRRRIERGTLGSVRDGDRRLVPMDELLKHGLLVPLDQAGSRPARTGQPAVLRPRELAQRLQALEELVAAQAERLAALEAHLGAGAGAAVDPSSDGASG